MTIGLSGSCKPFRYVVASIQIQTDFVKQCNRMSKPIFCCTPEVLTYEKWVGLALVCKLLRRERLPAIVYDSL